MAARTAADAIADGVFQRELWARVFDALAGRSAEGGAARERMAMLAQGERDQARFLRSRLAGPAPSWATDPPLPPLPEEWAPATEEDALLVGMGALARMRASWLAEARGAGDEEARRALADLAAQAEQQMRVLAAMCDRARPAEPATEAPLGARTLQTLLRLGEAGP